MLLWIQSEEETAPEPEKHGRHTSSVFPTQASEQQAAEVEALKLAIGASRFVSESQVGAWITECTGFFMSCCSLCTCGELIAVAVAFDLQLEEAGNEGREARESLPMVPLAEVLAENKRKKEEEFQEQWRQMKQGVQQNQHDVVFWICKLSGCDCDRFL